MPCHRNSDRSDPPRNHLGIHRHHQPPLVSSRCLWCRSCDWDWNETRLRLRTAKLVLFVQIRINGRMFTEILICAAVSVVSRFDGIQRFMNRRRSTQTRYTREYSYFHNISILRLTLVFPSYARIERMSLDENSCCGF